MAPYLADAGKMTVVFPYNPDQLAEQLVQKIEAKGELVSQSNSHLYVHVEWEYKWEGFLYNFFVSAREEKSARGKIKVSQNNIPWLEMELTGVGDHFTAKIEVYKPGQWENILKES